VPSVLPGCVRHSSFASEDEIVRAGLLAARPWATFVKADPLLKNVKHDPRYVSFLKKISLPT